MPRETEPWKGKHFIQRVSQLNLCWNAFILILKACKQLQMVSGRPAEVSRAPSLERPVGMVRAAARGFHMESRSQPEWPRASVAASAGPALARNLARHWEIFLPSISLSNRSRKWPWKMIPSANAQYTVSGGKGSTSGRTALALGALRDWECRTDSQRQPSTPPAWFLLCFTYSFPYFIYLAVSDHSHITWDLSLGLASSLAVFPPLSSSEDVKSQFPNQWLNPYPLHYKANS